MQDTDNVDFIVAFINDRFQATPIDYDQGYAHGSSSLQAHIAGTD